MDTVEVVLSPGSAVKCFPTCVEQRDADAEDYTDRLSRDRYYCSYVNPSSTFLKPRGASAAFPMVARSSATDALHAPDAISIHSPFLSEAEMDAVLSRDRSNERGGSPTKHARDIRSTHTAAELREAQPNCSRVCSSTELVRKEHTSSWGHRSANSHHADPACTRVLQPPPPISYRASRSDPRTRASASGCVTRSFSALPSSSTPSTKAGGTRGARPPVLAAHQPCQSRGRRAVMQKSIACFLNVEKATDSDVRSGPCSACTSCSPAREASAATSASVVSSPLPRTPAGEEERHEKRLATRWPVKMSATVGLRAQHALFASLPVNQTRSAASKAYVSTRAVSTSSPASCADGLGSDRRNGHTTLTAKHDVTATAEMVRFSSPLAKPFGKALVFSPFNGADRVKSTSVDTTATASAEGSLGTVKAHVFGEVAVTAKCVVCQLSINLLALLLAGTQLPEVCYCPLCGSRCSWVACVETV
ncbi:hypothetical protein LSCM4_03829 [Leishmania orientalis]|uniref:Uncharacterized protein n=1 Tax=Leishmania orientalis TaxID=2249476 RepID=A0A836HD31_9TRYP|nr:hypothetical protein LSCM4_03829 [Leishmania orientalis]